jgi:hypothetical protein
MNMVGSPKVYQMHLCNHLWIYFLLGMRHIHANFLFFVSPYQCHT